MLIKLRTTLTALAGLVGVVPGILALTGLGNPPGSRWIFGVLLEVVGAGAIVAVLMRKTSPRWLSPTWGIASAVALVTAYFLAFDTAVEKHGYYEGEETPVLIPFLTPRWAPPTLDTLVACAQNLPCPSVMADYSAADVAHAITRYGPDDILPLIPPWPRRLTVVALFLLYASCIALLVVTFGFWGRSLGARKAPVETLNRTGRIGVRKRGGRGQSRKVRILFLASNPQTTTRLDLEEELRSLEAELRAVRFREEIALTAGHAVRPDDLLRLLRQEKPTIVHFSGHGSRDGIVLRSDTGHMAVSGVALARLFRDRGVALIVLNACFSDKQAMLLSEVVSAVVGTTHAVGDEAARRFSAAFYRTLGDGHSLKDAFRDGGDAVAVHELEDVYRAYGKLDEPLCGRGSV